MQAIYSYRVHRGGSDVLSDYIAMTYKFWSDSKQKLNIKILCITVRYTWSLSYALSFMCVHSQHFE